MKTGCTSFWKLKRRAGPYQPFIFDGARCMASGRSVTGAASPTRFSWQPTHPYVSPGCTFTPLRIDCTIFPFSSSAWK